ncbi:hypothetical protein BaRGS_00024556, partial [Batillaria attramentaria]
RGYSRIDNRGFRSVAVAVILIPVPRAALLKALPLEQKLDDNFFISFWQPALSNQFKLGLQLHRAQEIAAVY